VQAIAGAVMVAGKPADHRFFLKSFTGVSDLRIAGNTATAATPRGELTIMDPVGFNGAFGHAAPPVRNGARLAALRFAAADLATTEDVLQASGVKFAAAGGRLVIAPEQAMGATIVFERARDKAA
jgi:hypothetical protein